MHSPCKLPQRMTVSLKQVEPPAVRRAQRDPDSASMQIQPEQARKVLNADTGDYHLDMNQIRGLVNEYARQEFATVKPTAPVHGDYFGTYSGDDSGIFFFNLDRTGHATGTGQSDTRGIAFLIEGRVLPDGVIQMVGIRKDGDSKFTGTLSGRLDMRTGKIAGTWSVSGRLNLKGTFSGQREMQVSMN